MELVSGIEKIGNANYNIYYIKSFSDQLKNAIRKRLVKICEGYDNSQSTHLIYSYENTAKEFIKRYNSKDDKAAKLSEQSKQNRKKGLIGELLVHIILELENNYIIASPFFNMEERSFKKGYDIALFEESTNEMWIVEVKSGEKQKSQKDVSATIVGLLNTAKNDLNKRLNDKDTQLWRNAINAAKLSMSSNSNQKEVVVELLANYADGATNGINKSQDINVILSGVLFHPMTDLFNEKNISNKQNSVVKENLFKNVLIIAIQKETYQAVYDFLKSEANDNEK